jgi:hypothetical protein
MDHECAETSDRHNALWRRVFRWFRNWQPTSQKEAQPKGMERELIEVEQPQHTLQTEDGAIYMFCSDICFEHYEDRVDQDADYVGIRPPWYECMSCYWCGKVVHRVEDCFRHGQHCPVLDWKMTYQANVVLYALAQLVRGDIPEELIDDCEVLAGQMSPDTDGRIIAQACWQGWQLFG